jgi:hypothetical protein
MLLECGDSLLEHCYFLDTKLEIKVRVYWWTNISSSPPEILYNGKIANEADLLPM